MWVWTLEPDGLDSDPGLTLTGCRILGISLTPSVFQSPHLQSGYKTNSYLMGLLWGLCTKWVVQYLRFLFHFCASCSRSAIPNIFGTTDWCFHGWGLWEGWERGTGGGTQVVGGQEAQLKGASLPPCLTPHAVDGLRGQGGGERRRSSGELPSWPGS